MIEFVGYDLFCGAGGTTQGIEQAMFDNKRIAKVIACINHDPYAIYSHSYNHRDVKHFTEDIKTFDLSHLPLPERNEKTIVYLWASLECTNYSNAKGGLPRDPDSRTLPIHLYRYIEYIRPDYILIENVREFMDWGPLDKNLKPIKEKKGKDFKKWVDHIKSYGYNYDHKLLTAANLGAHTIRRRYFGVFAKIGLPISFPDYTHSKLGKDGLEKWKPVREVLDLNDYGKSIFEKNLVENTLKRIYAGLVKFVAKGDNSFITKYMGNNAKTGINNGKSIEEPCLTITTQNRLAIIQPQFLMKYFGNGENVHDLNENSPTLKTKEHLALVSVDQFIDCSYSNGKQNSSLENPSGSILTVPKERLITTERIQFIDEQYGCSKGKSIDEPGGTITINPKQNLISCDQFIDMHYKNSNPHTIEDPARTITTNPVHSIVTAEKFQYIMDSNYNNVGRELELPSSTLLASKRYNYLITTESGNIAIKIYESDSEYMKKIKLFMAAYGIIDIKMRMLKVSELLAIQGFPKNYILKGNQTLKKKFIGNAVVPIVAQKMFEALYHSIKDLDIESIRKAA